MGFGVHSFRITQMLNAQDDIHGLFKGYGSGTNAERWGLDLLE